MVVEGKLEHCENSQKICCPLSIIVPTYNEAGNIVELVARIRRCFIQKGEDSSCYRIVIMDDSPNNETADIARQMGCYVVQRHGLKGLSRAIVDGIKICSSEKIIVMDADLQHPPELLGRISELLDKYDLVVASRYVKGGGIEGWTPLRIFISKVTNTETYPLVPKIKDRMSGYFGFKKDVVSGVIDNLGCDDGYKIGLEIMVKGNWKSSVEIPFVFKQRQKGETKLESDVIGGIKLTIKYIKSLLKLAFWKWRMLPFMIVGGIGYFVNMAVYYPLTLWFKETVTFLGQEFYLPPFLVSSFIAITSNYILNKRFTFGDYKVKTAGYVKYLATCSASLPIEMALIFLFVHFMGFIPIVAVALAILLVFVGRYAVVRRIVWHKKQRNIC